MLKDRIHNRFGIILLSFIAIGLFASMNAFAYGEQFGQFGGWTGLKGKETGFFHVEQLNGRWWIITPEGNIFWSTGMYCVRISGIPETGTGKRDYKDNSLAKHGSVKEWSRVARLRLKKWGFNTIGDWSSPSIYQGTGVAYVIGLDLPRDSYNVIPKGHYGYFPDVFSLHFRDAVSQKMEGIFKSRPDLIKDPNLLGYFLADEPSWYGSKGRRGSLVDDFIRLDKNKAGKIQWVDFLKKSYADIAALNSVWQTSYRNFEELLSVKKIKDTDASQKVKLAFLKTIASEFSKVLVETLRKFDSHHMVLGTRPTRLYPEVLEGLGKHVDIFGLSHYGLNKGYRISPDFDKSIDTIYKHTKRPAMLGALISAKDTGLPYGIVKTQQDRGISYWRYLKKVASRPEIVGLHWFQYFDPPKKCYDSHASNWGLVNENDDPYQEAVQLIAEANKMVYAYALGLSDFAPDFGFSFGSLQASEERAQKASELRMLDIPVGDEGFEQGRRFWKLQSWKGSPKIELDRSEKHGGNQCVKITGSGTSWESVGVAMQYSPKIIIKPGYDYKISGWIRTENVENFAAFRIKLKYTDGTSDVITTGNAYGTSDWQYVEKIFSPRGENSVSYIGAHLVGNGIAWFDDMKLQVSVGSSEDADSFVLDNSKPAEIKLKKLYVDDPGFEQGDRSWQFQTWKGNPQFEFDEKVVHSGKKSARITGTRNAWESVGVVLYKKLDFILDPAKEYALGCWIKTEDVNNQAFLRLKVSYSDGSIGYFQTESISGTGDWEKAYKQFRLKKAGKIDYFVGQLVGKGTVWFDEVFIGEVLD